MKHPGRSPTDAPLQAGLAVCCRTWNLGVSRRGLRLRGRPACSGSLGWCCWTSMSTAKLCWPYSSAHSPLLKVRRRGDRHQRAEQFLLDRSEREIPAKLVEPGVQWLRSGPDLAGQPPEHRAQAVPDVMPVRDLVRGIQSHERAQIVLDPAARLVQRPMAGWPSMIRRHAHSLASARRSAPS